MLLSHQSSMGQGSQYDNFLNATYAGQLTGQFPSAFDLLDPNGAFYSEDIWEKKAPGTYFSYSNVNYGLIGTLIE